MAQSVLQGQTALVTGAGRGIGRAVATAFANAGANLVLLDRDSEPLAESLSLIESVAAENGARAMAQAVDITDAASVALAIRMALERFSTIDILMNNAGVGPQLALEPKTGRMRKFWELPDDIWLLTLRTNVIGPQIVTKAVLPGMLARKHGRIITVTTSLSTMHLTGRGAYGPSKAALEAHARIMAHDLDGTGITANVLIPGGPVDTRMIDPLIPVARSGLLRPEVMGPPAVWLASDAARDVTGRRFLAALWDESLTVEQRLARAGAPIAWPQLGLESIHPKDMPH